MARAWPRRPWPDAVPRFVTPRNPERDTFGSDVADISRQLGFEPMPWSVDNWQTMYEYTVVEGVDGEPVKRLWYREARITIVRQSSKTTGTLAEEIDRMVNGEARGWGARPVAGFTMQHASDARAKLVEEWYPIVAASPLRELMLPGKDGFVRSNGKESFRWRGGGRMVTFPPSEKGAHGGVLDRVDIDEAFAHVDDRAESGSRPAMITRPSPQLAIKSTAGTAASTYLRDKVDDGRERVESGLDSHVYYLEYAANPEAGDDIHDPEHWHRWMPALGYTQSLEALIIEHDNYMSSSDPDKGEAGWARAFCNLWTSTVDRIIPEKPWRLCGDPNSKVKDHGRLYMAVDASPSLTGDRWTAITISGYRDDGRVHSQVIEHRPGLAWAAGAIGGLTRRWNIDTLRLDPKSPIAAVLPDIEREANTTIELTDATEMAAACSRLHEDIMATAKALEAGEQPTRGFAHLGQPMLNEAVDGAAKRILLDGWAFARRKSSADICPIVAVAQSHWSAVENADTGLITMQAG